jgi:hypothetical protein
MEEHFVIDGMVMTFCFALYMTINYTCSFSKLISTKGEMDINEHERLSRLIMITR